MSQARAGVGLPAQHIFLERRSRGRAGMGGQVVMPDRVFANFLQNALIEARELAAESHVLRVCPMPPLPPSSYLCQFGLPYLRRLPSGLVEVAPGPVLAGIHFPEDYLRAADPHLYLKIASVLTPDLVHPNVHGSTVCLGSAFAPGTPIRVLLWELFDILAYRNVSLDERNALNPMACRLLRAHPHLFDKLESRPLRRGGRPPQVAVEKR